MGEKRPYKLRKPGGGRKKLKQEFDAGKNPKEVVEKITETVGEFVVGAVQSDDITLLSISYKG